MRVRSAERPNIAAADALDSPSGESWRAKLGAEQAQVSATSIRRVAVETVVMTASAVARHPPGNGVVNSFLIICF